MSKKIYHYKAFWMAMLAALAFAAMCSTSCAGNRQIFKDYQEDTAFQNDMIFTIADYNIQLSEGLITTQDYARYLRNWKDIAEMDSIYREMREKVK